MFQSERILELASVIPVYRDKSEWPLRTIVPLPPGPLVDQQPLLPER
jgi:hypothetical protein